MALKHGFTEKFFTDTQAFVAAYTAKIVYEDIRSDTNYSILEQEHFYARNHDTIDQDMRKLILNFFVSYVSRPNYSQYHLPSYCFDIANLILKRSFPPNLAKKDQSLIQYVLITFLILPIFQKYEQLQPMDKEDVIARMNEAIKPPN
jgi:hypothetical protein